MEHHKKHADDMPLGAPHIAKDDASETRPFEMADPSDKNQDKKPVKTWATMPLWKKIVVIWFSIVCAFGVYDTIFPSEKSLKFEELLPIIATPTPTAVPTIVPSPLTSPTPLISPTSSK